MWFIEGVRSGKGSEGSMVGQGAPLSNSCDLNGAPAGGRAEGGGWYPPGPC